LPRGNVVDTEVDMPTRKTVLMLLGLVLFTGASTACFGLFTRDEPRTPAVRESCDGLVGQAKVDCEQRNADRAP
jgi:hypothetical protein